MKNFLKLFVLLLSFPALAQNTTGIIYGKNHAFSLTAPEGWILDNHSGAPQGLHAVFYEVGQTWKGAATVMYANTASLELPEHNSLAQLINYDVENFKKNYSGIVITDAPDIAIKDNVIAKVKHMSGDAFGNYEAIAYIDAGKTGIMIVFSSRTKETFDAALPAFDELVKSFVFIAEKVVMGSKKKS
jgi:hypothetical protein